MQKHLTFLILGALILAFIAGVRVGRRFSAQGPGLISDGSAAEAAPDSDTRIPSAAEVSASGTPGEVTVEALPGRQDRVNEDVSKSWAQHATAIHALLEGGGLMEEDLVEFAGIVTQLSSEQLAMAAELLAEDHQAPRGQFYVQALFHQWTRIDRPAALAGATTMPMAWRLSALSAVVTVWSSSDPTRALTWLKDAAPSQYRDELLMAAADGMSRNDPAGAYRMIVDQASGPSSAYRVQTVLARWAGSDPAAAAEAALTYWTAHPQRYGGSHLFRSVLAKWVESDRAGAMAWVRRVADVPSRRVLEEGLVAALAMREPRHAMDVAAAATEGERQNLMGMALLGWFQQDAAAAKAYLNAVRDATLHEKLLARVAQVWLDSDPDELASLAMNLPEGTSRRNLLERIGRDWGARDTDAFLNWLEGVPADRDQRILIEAAATSLAWREPETAMAFYHVMPEGSSKLKLGTRILQGWARDDPLKALAWFERQPVAAQRRLVLGSGLGRDLARIDSQQALDFALSFEPPAIRHGVLGEVILSWASADREAALHWVTTQASRDDFDAAAAAVATVLAKDHPEQAAALVQQMDGAAARRVDYAIAQSWGTQDPAAMLAWAGTQTDRDLSTFLQVGFRAWARQDPLAAAAGLARLEPTSGVTAATRSVVAEWSRVDPARTAAWVMQFPDEQMRNESLESVFSHWASADQQAAEKFLERTDDVEIRDRAAKALVKAIAKFDPEGAASWVNRIQNEALQREAKGHLP